MTAGAGQSYTYDGANRLKEVGSGGTNVYGFDGDGRRVKKTEGGTTVYYVSSTVLGQTAMEVTSAAVQTSYVYHNGRVTAQLNADGQFYWRHGNHLGSTRAMTDASGNLAYKAQHDPYGQVLSEWSASGNNGMNKKKFTDYERDSSGLDYAAARIYNSTRGKFLQSDPAGMKSAKRSQPESLNRYAYSGNDPINNNDPSGRDWESWANYFGQMACAEQGASFLGITFLPSGNLGFMCQDLPRALIPTKQMLEEMGDWRRPSYPGRIVLNSGGIRGGEIKNFNPPSSSVTLNLPSCEEKTKFRAYVEFSGYSIKQFIKPVNEVHGTSDIITSDEDQARKEPILGVQNYGFEVSNDNRKGTFWIDIILNGKDIEAVEKYLRFVIIAIDEDGEQQEVAAKLRLNCPQKSGD